jgi:uncharacterized protein YdeI (BOF family)
MKNLLTAIATIALAMALSVVSFAQQDQSAQPSAQPSTSDTQNTQQPTADQQGTQPQPSAPDQDSSNSMQANQASSFSGTVVKAGGKYVLKTSDMSYQLDEQQKAKKYVGQQVKVSGTLDNNTSTIHVSDISPMS